MRARRTTPGWRPNGRGSRFGAALAATAGALGVGRLAPDLLQVAAWLYVVLDRIHAAIDVPRT